MLHKLWRIFFSKNKQIKNLNEKEFIALPTILLRIKKEWTKTRRGKRYLVPTGQRLIFNGEKASHTFHKNRFFLKLHREHVPIHFPATPQTQQPRWNWYNITKGSHIPHSIPHSTSRYCDGHKYRFCSSSPSKKLHVELGHNDWHKKPYADAIWMLCVIYTI